MLNVSKGEAAQFAQELSGLIDGGTPILTAMDSLAQKQANPDFQQVIAALRGQVQQGLMMADVMPNYPEAFTSADVDAVREGERTGTLHEALAGIRAH